MGGVLNYLSQDLSCTPSMDIGGFGTHLPNHSRTVQPI